MTFKEKLWISFWDGPGVFFSLTLGVSILVGAPAFAIVHGHVGLGITLFGLLIILATWAAAFYDIRHK